jgi:hypothetical protein
VKLSGGGKTFNRESGQFCSDTGEEEIRSDSRQRAMAKTPMRRGRRRIRLENTEKDVGGIERDIKQMSFPFNFPEVSMYVLLAACERVLVT